MAEKPIADSRLVNAQINDITKSDFIFLPPIVTSQPTTGERKPNPSELKLNPERGAPFRGPWRLVYYEAYIEEADARGREVFLKSGTGRTFLRKQCHHYFERHPARRRDDVV